MLSCYMSVLGTCLMSLLVLQLCLADEAVDAVEAGDAMDGGDTYNGGDFMPSPEDYENMMTAAEKRSGLLPIPFPCNGYDHLPRCLHSGKGPRKTWTKSGKFCVCLCPAKWVGPECGYAADSLGKRGFPWKIMAEDEEDKRGFPWKLMGADGKRNFPWKLMGAQGKRAFPWKLMGDHKEE